MTADTWPKLRALWDERDHRYSRRVANRQPAPLTPAEAVAVREYRRTEVAVLPPGDRAKALLALNRWYPPAARL